MRVVWELDVERQRVACAIGPHENGGLQVVLRLDGVPQFGRQCADQTEADYVARAWWQDQRRGLPLGGGPLK